MYLLVKATQVYYAGIKTQREYVNKYLKQPNAF